MKDVSATVYNVIE